MNERAPLAILKSRFGYDSFWHPQEEIIANVLAGLDSLALMPTGGGKSLCYQLPALIFGGVTLVVSPLIALMKDQVDALNANGIAARFINSTLPASAIGGIQDQARRGQVKILYVAPERLAVPGFRRFLGAVNLSLIAIDEAHCISEWGHEFRPDYRNLRQLRQDFPSVPTIALTATATEQVREDIIVQLGLQRAEVFVSSFNRPNLRYSILPKSEYWERLLSLLRQHQDQSTIIYCFSRQETEDLSGDLNAEGFSARPYHAGLDGETRRRTQENFVRDRVPIIVATIAFGMGIDKPDIRLVVHQSLPKSVEAYYQETGRAGRDGLPSDCVLFFAYADKAKQDYFINQIEDASERRSAGLKLAKMLELAQLPTCRRRFLLEYFGERWTEDNCSGCDVCLRSGEEFDATEISQKILSAVIRTGERFGANHVIQVLRGSREKRILQLGHDQLSVYGIAKDFGRPQLRDIIGQLQARGYLLRDTGEYPSLAVAPEGREFLRKRQSLRLLRPAGEVGKARVGSGNVGPSSGPREYDQDLFEELRALRRRLADAGDVPAFVIFGDVTLRQMATDIPRNEEQLSRVTGVGEVKLEQYGPKFLDVIRTYSEANGLLDRTVGVAGRQDSEGGRLERERKRPLRTRGTTYGATMELLSQRLSISQIAHQRGLTESTIIAHIERLAGQSIALDLDHLMPAEERLRRIEKAFGVTGSAALRPVLEFLGDDFTYDELRLARVHLRQKGRLED